MRGLRFTFGLLTAQPQACAGLVLHVVFFFFLTAQPQACAGLVLHVVFFFFNRAAAGVRGSSFARCFFFFLVLSVTWPRPRSAKCWSG